MSGIPQIISLEEYSEIRDRLGNISQESLPDEVIERTSYLKKAEAIVRNRILNWEVIVSSDLDDSIYLRSAVFAYTAYLLIPRLQSLVKSEDIIDYKYVAFSPDDWKKKAEALLYEFNSNLNEISSQDNIDPFLFTVDGPTRVKENDLLC